MSQDLCGLSGSNRLETYRDVELFLTLIGTGVTRSLYALTAHDIHSRALLFDLRIEAGAAALDVRARRAGIDPDDQAAAIALGYAHRIVDAAAYRRAAHLRLDIAAEGETLRPNVLES